MSDLMAFEGVTAGYGAAIVLHDVSIAIRPGESLALLGRNGVGKTTFLETLMGNTRLRGGTIRFRGQDITRLRSYERVRAGLGWVPQEREVFPSLTVLENLTVVARAAPAAPTWTLPRIFDLFPRPAERRGNYGGQLSGGEQQMLAIGRALMTNPSLLLLDEPMEGLAPIIVEELATAIRRMGESDGLTCIIVEQHPILAFSMTRNAAILERGTIVHAAPCASLAQDHATLDRMLGIGVGDASPPDFAPTAAPTGDRP